MSKGKTSRFLAAIGIACLLGMGLMSSPAQAQTANSVFQVTATVDPVCTIAANDLAFGTYDPLGPDLDVATTIDVTCTNLSAYEIQLDGGGTGNPSARQMTGPTTLNYEIFRNFARTDNWGNSLGSDTQTGVGNGGVQVVDVYGRIPGGQTGALVGNYTDTVTATINF